MSEDAFDFVEMRFRSWKRIYQDGFHRDSSFIAVNNTYVTALQKIQEIFIE